MNYRPDIDGLRTIAVGLVIAFHAGFPGFSGGYIGVDVFFVISGYLITGALFKEVSSTSSLSFTAFYAKRFKRLMPALLFLIVSVLFIWGLFFLGIPSNTDHLINSIRYGVAGLANLYFKRHTGGYFDSASDEMPLLHLWSLSVEEQFYFVWPFLLFASAKISNIAKISLRKVVVTILLLLAASSLALSEYYLFNVMNQEAFYWMPPRAWELSLGGIAFFVKPKSLSKYIGLFGLLIILAVGFLFDNETKFPGLFAAIPVMATVLIILSKEVKLLSRPLMVRLGVLSYGWYLWHWPLLVFARLHFLSETPPLSWRILAVISSLIMAQISLRYIETPLRNSRKGSLKIISAAVASAVFVITLSLPIRSIELTNIPASFSSVIRMANERASAKFNCLGQECTRRYAPNKETGIILWGDSHSQAYFPMFDSFAKERLADLSYFGRTSLPPLLGVESLYLAQKKTSVNIQEYNNSVFKSIEAKMLRKPNRNLSVVLSARWPAYVGIRAISVKDKKSFLESSRSEDASLKVFQSTMHQTIESLFKVGVHKILVVLPYPEFKYNVLHCLDQEKCNTPRMKFNEYTYSVRKILYDEVSKFKNVRLLDPASTFCSFTICPEILDHSGKLIPVVYDDDHPSVAATMILKADKIKDLDWLIEI